MRYREREGTHPQNMYFQCDGAPCHYARQVTGYLNHQYPGKWIGRGGPIAWPPRSPDLNPVDLFIWGCYKELVYHTEFSTLEELRTNLNEVQDQIKQKTQSFRDLRRNFLRRCHLCIEAGGGHFEHLL